MLTIGRIGGAGFTAFGGIFTGNGVNLTNLSASFTATATNAPGQHQHRRYMFSNT